MPNSSRMVTYGVACTSSVRALGHVDDAAVVTWLQPTGRRVLIAYYVPCEGVDANRIQAIRSEIISILASYVAQPEHLITAVETFDVTSIPSVHVALLREYYASCARISYLAPEKATQIFNLSLAYNTASANDNAEWFEAQGKTRDPENEVRRLGASLQVAISTISELNEKLTAAHHEIERLSTELTAQSGSGGALKAELLEAKGAIDDMTRALETAYRERDAAVKSLSDRDSLLKDVRAQRDALQATKVDIVGELESTKQAMFEANRRAKHAISSLDAERKSTAPVVEEQKTKKKERLEQLQRLEAAERDVATAAQNRGVLAGQLDAARCELQVSRGNEARMQEELKLTCEEIFHLRERLEQAEALRSRDLEVNAIKIEKLSKGEQKEVQVFDNEDMASLLEVARQELKDTTDLNANMATDALMTKEAFTEMEERLRELTEKNRILECENAVALEFLVGSERWSDAEHFRPSIKASAPEDDEGNDTSRLARLSPVPYHPTSALSKKETDPPRQRKISKLSIHRSGSMDLSFSDTAASSPEVEAAVAQVKAIFEENELVWPLEPVQGVPDGYRFVAGLGSDEKVIRLSTDTDGSLIVFAGVGTEKAHLMEFLADN